GEFVWREPGSRHVAWCPDGGLMLAMFQIPNKFFERDGRVTDLSGKDWEDVWGEVLGAEEVRRAWCRGSLPRLRGRVGRGKPHGTAAASDALSARATPMLEPTARGRGGMVDARDLKTLL